MLSRWYPGFCLFVYVYVRFFVCVGVLFVSCFVGLSFLSLKLLSLNIQL